MSHHHDHDHSHDHGDAHHHGHSHSDAPLSFSKKLIKLLDHWIEHNDHHAADFCKWAKDARENGQMEVADILESAAELTHTLSDRFREAGEKVQPD